MFIEFNIGTKERLIINMDLVKKITPRIGCTGCTLWFSDGVENVMEEFDWIRDKVEIKKRLNDNGRIK